MKILIQNTLFFPRVIGGAEVSSHLLGQELRARGIAADAVATTGVHGRGREVHTRSTADGRGTVFEAPAHGLCDPLPADQAASATGPLVRGLNHFANVYSRRWRALFAEIIVRSRPDIVHTNNVVGLTPAIWAAAREHGIPVVHTLRDYHLLCPRTTLLRSDQSTCRNPPPPCRLLSSLKLRQTRQVEAVTAPSRFVLGKHLDSGGFPLASTHVVPNALEGPPHALADRRETGSSVRGLFLGQMGVHKGVSLLLEVLPRLFADPRCDALHFDFAGRGPLVPQVRDLAATYPRRVKYHGHVEGQAKQDLLRAAGFMVVPSLWPEPFGRSVIDAFSWGVPVIGSDRGGIPEIITQGRDGLVTPPEPRALEDAMRKLTTDRESRLEMGAAARRRAEDFTLDRQVDAFVEIYETISGKRAEDD